MSKKKKVKISSPPSRTVNQFTKDDKSAKGIIDFTKYPNWCNCVEFKGFTNKCESHKHAKSVLSNILFDLFPFVQNHIKEIQRNQIHEHCHMIDAEHYSLAKKIIEKVNGVSIDDDEVSTIWYLGVKQGVRILAWILEDDSNYIFYPLAVDTNHLIYPDKKHNQKDYHNFSIDIKI